MKSKKKRMQEYIDALIEASEKDIDWKMLCANEKNMSLLSERLREHSIPRSADLVRGICRMIDDRQYDLDDYFKVIKDQDVPGEVGYNFSRIYKLLSNESDDIPPTFPEDDEDEWDLP